jgi:hypothetical protein
VIQLPGLDEAVCRGPPENESLVGRGHGVKVVGCLAWGVMEHSEGLRFSNGMGLCSWLLAICLSGGEKGSGVGASGKAW